MSIMLGNQSVSQIEKRLGIEFPEEIREFMNKTHQSEASNIAKGKWHCFDLPFNLVCGDIEVATGISKSKKFACIIFKNIPRQEIGSPVLSPGKTIEEEKPEMVITFTDPKSIDVILKHLIAAKKSLINTNKKKGKV